MIKFLKHILIKGGVPAKGNGGAVQMIGGVLIAINVTFVGNRAAADSSGGALYTWNARNILLSGVTIAVEHAQGADGVDMLPLSLQKFVGMGLAYIEGAREKANQDVANAVKNEPARPMQYERLDKALKQALKFNVQLQGLSPESKQQQENVKDMLLTAAQ